MEIEATPSEFYEEEIKKKVAEGKIPKFVIKRKQKSFVDKSKTPMWQLEQFFIREQEARRNSTYTIKHYEQTFRVFYEFLAFNYAENADTIDAIFDNAKDVKNPYVEYGSLFPIAVLENDDLQREFGEYLMDRREASEQTVLSYFRDYRAFMYYAMGEGWIEPFAITVKDKEPPIKQTYSDSEIKKLLKKPSTDNFEENRNWVLINYLLDTGNRIQTIINLKVKDIDFDDKFININTQKSGKTTRLGLTKKLARVLKEYINDYRTDENGVVLEEDFLFCNRYGEKLTDSGIKKAIKEYNLSRGVQKTSCHLFRHTYAKLWITSGGDLISLKQALGHSSIKMVQRYANLYATDVRDKMEEHSALNQQRISSGETIKKRTVIKKNK